MIPTWSQLVTPIGATTGATTAGSIGETKIVVDLEAIEAAGGIAPHEYLIYQPRSN
jgi:hypothetical protein